MGMIINIDEALKLRTEYNVIGEPLHAMLKERQEEFEKANPIDLLFNRNSISTFQETYTDSIGFAHAFAETADFSNGPIFNTADGFSATYRTRTFQGGFIVTQQAIEDRQVGSIKDTASKFQDRWNGDLVEYAMTSVSAGFGEEVKWGSKENGGESRLKLYSADTVDGDILNAAKNPLFFNKHTIVKREDMPADHVSKNYQSNLYHADINVMGSDSARIAKLADVINQCITIMENYKDDNGKYAGLKGAKTIVTSNEPHIKAAINTALSMPTFKQGESDAINPAYQRATLQTTPYLNDIPQCAIDATTKTAAGFFIVDKEYNAANHGLELTERIPFTLEATELKRPKGIAYDGRQRFDINVASWRGIMYVSIGTLVDEANKWNTKANYTEITTTAAVVTPVQNIAASTGA